MASVINFTLSIYIRSTTQVLAQKLRVFGSLLIAIALLIFAFAFILEPPAQPYDRDITFMSVIFILSGALIHALACLIDLRFVFPSK